MTTPCERCAGAVAGSTGHGGLEFYVGGPWPGQHIFKCSACNERWIRHAGTTEQYGWTRYADIFPMRTPVAPPGRIKG